MWEIGSSGGLGQRWLISKSWDRDEREEEKSNKLKGLIIVVVHHIVF